jgi:Tol biopolymer transport system component
MMRLCEICHSEIKSEHEIIFCPSDHTPHHKGCWDFYGGCGTFGCKHNPLTDGYTRAAPAVVQAKLLRMNKIEILEKPRNYFPIIAVTLLMLLGIFVVRGVAFAILSNRPQVIPTNLIPIPTNKPQPTVNNTVTKQATPTNSHLVSKSGPGGHWIAYAYGEVRQELDIYLLDYINGDTRQLTSGKALDESPTFSPDGRYLAYSSCRGDCEIYQIEIESNLETQLTNLAIQAKFPEWCRKPSRNWILFEARPKPQVHQIWMIDVESGEARSLTKDPSDSRPTWSPDCTKVAFGRAKRDTDANGILTGNDYLDVYIVDVETREITQVINTPDKDEFTYSWSPDGNWIAFTRVSDDTNHDGFINLNDQSDLFIVHPDGSGEINITQNRFSVFSPSWSYDSQTILFTVFLGSGKQEIWWYELSSQEFRRVTNSGPYYHPTWSP